MRGALCSLALLALLAVGRPAYADEARNDAIAGAAVDCVSTIIAVEGYNLIEANPLGKLGYGLPACLLKPVGIWYADRQPEPARTEALTAQSALWTGVGANNLTIIAGKVLHAAGALRSAATGPVGYIVGLAVAAYIWHDTADEREFAGICAMERERTGNPDMKCIYRKERET